MVSWDQVPNENDDATPQNTDIYDSGDVFEYIVQYSTSRSMSSSKQLVLAVQINSGSLDAANSDTGCIESPLSDQQYQCTIPQLRTDTLYWVRVLANRGNPNSTGSGNSASRDYWTPTLSITTGNRWSAEMEGWRYHC